MTTKKLATTAKGSSKKKPVKKRKINFGKLSAAGKRMAIAQDVLERIRYKKFIPESGTFVKLTKFDDTVPKTLSLQDAIKDKENKCEVCAKGALFCSMIGFENKFTIGQLTDGLGWTMTARGQRLKSKEMKRLTKFFSKEQLTLIETTFEGKTYDFNVAITAEQERKCMEFHSKHFFKDGGSDKSVLRAICRNIIDNKGTFKP